MPNYDIILYWNAKSKEFMAEVAELPGVHGNGKTPDIAISEVRTAARSWLEHAVEAGEPIPRPAMKPMPA